MKKLKSSGAVDYYSLEYPEDVDGFEIEGFRYFTTRYGITEYPKLIKSWLRSSVRSMVVVGVEGKKVIGWIWVEKIEERLASDGYPTYCLRAIEVLSKKKSMKIGSKLVYLTLFDLKGHILTKPVNEVAKRFFSKLGFKSPGPDSIFDFKNYSGYLLMSVEDLNTFRKKRIIPAYKKVKKEEKKKAPLPIYSKNVKEVALVYDECYLKHAPVNVKDFKSKNSPEAPERLLRILSYLGKEEILEACNLIRPDKLSIKDLQTVHDKKYLEKIEKISNGGGRLIDFSTYVSDCTYDVLFYSAGGTYRACRAVLEGESDYAFAIVRPPGHHASRNKGEGFCIINNAAIALAKLKAENKIKKAIVINLDAHASNGTMEIFYEDPSVLVFSIHQDPGTMYPFKGFLSEIGKAKGRGYTVPIPLPQGSSDEEFKEAMKLVIKIGRQFKPELVLVECGFDCHAMDASSKVYLTTVGYANLTRMLQESFKSVPIAFTLEGGYNLDIMGKAMYAVISTLMYKGTRVKNSPTENNILFQRNRDTIKKFQRQLVLSKAILSDYWDVE